MSNVIPFPVRADHVSDEPINITEEDLERMTRAARELQIYLEQTTTTVDRLNAAAEELEEATKKKERGWLWFLLGAILGLGIG